MEPRNDFVMVSRSEGKKKTPGGIILPDQAQQKTTRGRVVAVGPGKLDIRSDKRTKIGLAVGDEVVFGIYSGLEIENEAGKEFVFLREEDIIAVVK